VCACDVSHPFDTGCLPLSYSGNPGVNGESDRGGTVSPKTRCRSTTSAAHRLLTVFLGSCKLGNATHQVGGQTSEKAEADLLCAGFGAAAYVRAAAPSQLTFLSSQLTFLSSQLTFLSSQLTFLSSQLTFLSDQLTFLSYQLMCSERCSWGSSLAQLTFLSRVLQYISSTGLGVLDCTGNCLLQVANWPMSCPS
jgi:hypothetical protein